jgi:hypothetical protein
MVSSKPNWADSVNHVLSFQIASRGDYRLARGQTVWPFSSSYALAFFEDSWSAFAVNGAIHTSASHECRVRGVHDGIRVRIGYVAQHQLHLGFVDTESSAIHAFPRLRVK